MKHCVKRGRSKIDLPGMELSYPSTSYWKPLGKAQAEPELREGVYILPHLITNAWNFYPGFICKAFWADILLLVQSSFFLPSSKQPGQPST